MLERLEERQASDEQQSKLFIKLENDIARLFDITSQHTSKIKNQDRILNGYFGVNKTLTGKVTFNKIIQIILITVDACIQTQALKKLLTRC